jgi:hypothetical protein
MEVILKDRFNSGTNWEVLAAMSDDNIDYSDIPPLTDDFFERATLRIPTEQAHNAGHDRPPHGKENRKLS